MGGTDTFLVQNKIQGFIKKLFIWKNHIKDQKHKSFDTFQTFIFKNNVNVSDSIITKISKHFYALKILNINFTEKLTREKLDCALFLRKQYYWHIIES